MKPAHMSFDAGRTWIDLLVAAELSHVDVADLCHGLGTRERRHHDWVGRLFQDPGTAELNETHRAGQEGGGDQFDNQAGLLQLAAQVSADVGPDGMPVARDDE